MFLMMSTQTRFAFWLFVTDRWHLCVSLLPAAYLTQVNWCMYVNNLKEGIELFIPICSIHLLNILSSSYMWNCRSNSF